MSFKPVYAKVGTIPAMIIIDGRSARKLAVHKIIRFRYDEHGSKWQRGLVVKTEPLFIELM